MSTRPDPPPAMLAVEDWPLAALLRSARSVVSAAVRHALDDGGLADLPSNGPYVISAMARTEAPLATVIVQLGLSKQAAGQLVDTLVARGFLDRSVDPTDRRRLVVRLTQRGAAAAEAVRDATERLERQLAAQLGARQVQALRDALAWLIREGAADV